MKPKESDFAHGGVEQCQVCERYFVHCLRFGGTTWVCALCFPWWVAARQPTEIHNHAAPYVSRISTSLPKRLDLRPRA